MFCAILLLILEVGERAMGPLMGHVFRFRFGRGVLYFEVCFYRTYAAVTVTGRVTRSQAGWSIAHLFRVLRPKANQDGVHNAALFSVLPGLTGHAIRFVRFVFCTTDVGVFPIYGVRFRIAPVAVVRVGGISVEW